MDEPTRRRRPAPVGIALGVGAFAVAATRWAVSAAMQPAERAAARLARQGRQTTGKIINRTVDTVLGTVDLTALVRKHVDIDAIAGDLDLPALVERLDVQNALTKVDLTAITVEVLDSVDLPEIVRESSGAMAVEAVRGIRSLTMRADDGLGHLADRVLRRSEPSRELAGARRAGFVTRMVAAVVDVAVVAAVAAVLYLGLAGVRFMWWPGGFSWPHPGFVISTAVAAGIAVVYLTISWVSTGRTYGAGTLGLRVLSGNRDLLGWPRALIRAVLCVVFPIGLCWALVSRSRRSVQDLIVRSIMVYDEHYDGGARAISSADRPAA